MGGENKMAVQKKEGITEVMRYRMSSRDVFYGGGVVNGARSITYMGDLAERLMVKAFHKTSKCVKVENIRLYAPVFSGDYMEFVARITQLEGEEARIECRSFKVAEIPANPEFESSIDILDEPILSTEAVFWYKPR